MISVIGIAGADGSGKSTLAKALAEWCHAREVHVRRMAFRDPVRQVAHLLGEPFDHVLGETAPDNRGRQSVIAPTKLVGDMLHDLESTCRATFFHSFWPRVTDRRISEMLAMSGKPPVIVLDDVQSQPEVTVVQNHGGLVFRIKRAGKPWKTGIPDASRLHGVIDLPAEGSVTAWVADVLRICSWTPRVFAEGRS